MTFFFDSWGYRTTNALGAPIDSTVKSSPLFSPSSFIGSVGSYIGVYANFHWTGEGGINAPAGNWLEYQGWVIIDGGPVQGLSRSACFTSAWAFDGHTDGSCTLVDSFYVGAGLGFGYGEPHVATIWFGLFGLFDPPGYRFISPSVTIFWIPEAMPPENGGGPGHWPPPPTAQYPEDLPMLAILRGDSSMGSSMLSSDRLPGLGLYSGSSGSSPDWRDTNFDFPPEP